jgi:hypothetical protein
VPTGVLNPKKLDVFFAGASYTQALTPLTVAQVGYDFFVQDGFLGNPYYADTLGREELPHHRLRHAFALRIAQYVPRLTLGLQLFYRLYFDSESKSIGPWGMVGHTIEPRIFKQLGRDVELRLGYRYHHEGSARFWCNSRVEIGCYGQNPQYHSIDPKFGAMHTSLVEAKLFWDLRSLAGGSALRSLLASGTVDISYGYFFESSYYGVKFNSKNEPPVAAALLFPHSYGGAHLIQTGYSLPF